MKFWKWLGVLVALSVLALLIQMAALPVFASSLYEYYNTGYTGYLSNSSSLYHGQTFTPGTVSAGAYTIKSVKFYVRRTNAIGTVTCKVETTSGGVPTGTLLASGTTNGDDWTLNTWEWHEITLGAGAPLSLSTMYAVYVYPTSGSFLLRLKDDGSGYDGGTALEYSGTWGTLNMDTMFETWGDSSSTAPTVTTQAGSSVEATTATGNATITATGGSNATERGICYSSVNNPPTTADSKEYETGSFGVEAFDEDLTGLSTGTTYYLRGYAINPSGTGYGNTVTILTKPAAPTNVAASDGTNGAYVTITWTKSTGATNYHVWRGANDLGAAGDVATFNDTGAPDPTVNPGTAAASDGTQLYVALSISGNSLTNGSSATYKVVASNATGNSADSSTDTGYRGGAMTYQWQMSAADSDADYSNISGGTTASYHCTTAPNNGDKRYFRCQVIAGNVNDYSVADEGYRIAGLDELETPLFTFVQITDTAIDSSSVADIIASASTEINTIPSPFTPSFVIFTGDLISAASAIELHYAKVNMVAFDAPVHVVVGDKDVSDGDKTTWENEFGARNYSFDVEGYHCIVLDSTEPSSFITYGGGFEPDTIAWLTAHLATVDPDTPIIVFTHHSFWSPMTYEPRTNLFCDVENPDAVLDLFVGYNLVGVVAGHSRQSMQYTDFNGTKWITSASMDANDTANVDYSAPGYNIVEVYSDRVQVYWVPLGKIYEYYIDPKTFVVSVGASGCDYTTDGTADDVQLQLAVDACHANTAHQANGGGTVVIKAGTYDLSGTGAENYVYGMEMYSNVWVIGLDETTVILKFCDASQQKIGIGNGYHGYLNNLRVENLTIDGNEANGVDPNDHTRYCGIEFNGMSEPDPYPGLDTNYSHDIVVEHVTVKNMINRGIGGYGNRRYACRWCTFDNVSDSVFPEHPNFFWQIEGCTSTNTSGSFCVGDCQTNSLMYNNDISSTPLAFQPWESALAGCVINDVHIVYNIIHDMTCGSVGGIDVSDITGSVEVTNNTFEDVVTTTKAAIRINDWFTGLVFGNNTFTNTAMHEYTTAYGNAQIWSPTHVTLTSVSSTSVTVQASGGYHMDAPFPGTPVRSSFKFQKATYDGSTVTLSAVTASQTSDTYVWDSLNPNYGYAFRALATEATAGDSAWCEWVYRHPQLTNHKPVLTAIGNKTVRDGTTISFTVTATDEDDDALTYSCPTKPAGSIFTAGTRTFDWTPSSQAGNHTVVFSVTDGDMSASEIITISVARYKFIYIWGMYDEVLNTPAEQTHFLDVCELEGANVIQMQFDEDGLALIGSSPALYASFIAAATARGIETHMIISGVLDDITTPTNHQPYIVAILTYNDNHSTVGEKIKGISWDIEDYLAGSYDDCITYMTAMQGYSYLGETILTQGLTLSFSVDGEDSNDFRTFLDMIDIATLEIYRDELDTGIAGGMIGEDPEAVTQCEAVGCDFVVGIETDELAAAYIHKSTFEEGKDGYKLLSWQADNYYLTNCDYYVGQYMHHYQRSVETWHEITASNFTYYGQTITATVTIKNNGYYQTSARGIVLQVKDADGNWYETSFIRVWTALQSRDLSLNFTLPVGVNLSTCTARLVTYDLDKRNSSRDPVYALWATNYVTLGLDSNIENNTLAQYTTAVKAHPTALNSLGRQEPELVILDYTGWSTLSGGSPSFPMAGAGTGLGF